MSTLFVLVRLMKKNAAYCFCGAVITDDTMPMLPSVQRLEEGLVSTFKVMVEMRIRAMTQTELC